MNKLAFTIPFLVSVTACFDSGDPQPNAASQLATACQIDVAVATARLSDEIALPEEPGKPGGSLTMSCCTDPKGCTPMEYPEDICQKLPTPDDAVVLKLHSTVPYTGDGWTTAYFSNCEPPPDSDKCDASETPYVFQPYPQTRWVVAFVPAKGGKGGTTAELYAVPAGATAVRIPSGQQVFPLLESTEGFANLKRPVMTPDGEEFVDEQNDCIPREDGCGFTCATC